MSNMSGTCRGVGPARAPAASTLRVARLLRLLVRRLGQLAQHAGNRQFFQLSFLYFCLKLLDVLRTGKYGDLIMMLHFGETF